MSANQARAIFIELIAHAPPEQWDGRLAALAGEDQELRNKVAGLLAAHRQADSFLERPAAPLGGTVEVPSTSDAPLDPRAARLPPAEGPGVVLAGRYKLQQQLGEGGMGTVFLAEQREPVQRQVALKLIKAGMDSRQVIARFEAERQALALMDHPNIARVLDAGTTESGRPFFVMDLVKGVRITTYCDEHCLTPRQRLELFVPICQAIQHAHQKGIIHRDVKPSNVLVALYDDKPVVKVIDFGVAKATGQHPTEQTLHTGFGAVVGTVEYMSPEQASFNQLDVDTRSDVYSLGVLLYELLAGSPPFSRKELEKAGVLEMLRVIREQEPPKPSTKLSSAEGLPALAANRGTEPAKLTRLVRGELDWIVMKALDKDRSRRYETANGFAQDLQRYLTDEPVLACPPSAGYRLRKFVRRNRAVLATVALVSTALIVGTVFSAWQAIRATRAEGQTQAELREKEKQYTRAENERQRAEANFLKTLEAVDGFLTEVGHKELALMPHMEPVRRRLLEKALGFFEEFLKSRRDDPMVRFEAGMAYRRVGHIQNYLGQLPQAERAYVQAVELLVQLGDEVPEKLVCRHELARAYHGQATLFRLLGRRQASEQTHDKARRILEQLAAQDPDNPDYQEDLAKSCSNLAVLLADDGRHGPAREALRQAVPIVENLIERYPDKLPYHDLLIMCYLNLARTVAATDNVEEADKLYRLINTRLRRAIERFGAAQSCREMELRVASRYGFFLLNSGRIPEGEKYTAQAAKIAGDFVRDFPSTPNYRQSLAEGQTHLALLFRQTNRTDQAAEYFKAARTTAEKLVADFPSVPLHHRLLGDTVHNSSLLLPPEEARLLLEEAIVHRQKAHHLDPKNRHYRDSLVKSFGGLAVSLDRLKAPAEEVDKAHQQAIDLARGLANDDPNDADSQINLGFALHNWAFVFVARKDYEQALLLLEQAIECQKKALRPNPGNPASLTILRKNYATLAEVLNVLKRPKALEMVGHWVATVKELARIYPQPDNWKAVIEALRHVEDLNAEDRFWMALAHGKLGNQEEGRKWFAQAVAAKNQAQRNDAELRRLRSEAAEALKITEAATPKSDGLQ